MVGPVLMLGAHRPPLLHSGDRIHLASTPLVHPSRAVARLEMALAPLMQHASIGGLHRAAAPSISPPVLPAPQVAPISRLECFSFKQCLLMTE